MKSTSKYIPELGKEILFFYDDSFHIGYVVDYDGSSSPRKWKWYSYVRNQFIEDVVGYWDNLPKTPSAKP